MLNRLNQKLQEFRQVPGSVWAVSTATMLISISAVMTFSISPFFMTKVLGLSLLSMGAIEGLTESIAQITRLFSGVVSDYLRKNKPTLLFGFILATISKPIFILANGVSMVVISKVMERLSNGIMATPRDAFVANAAPDGKRGQSLGLLMTMKTIGCTIGSLLIGALLLVTQNYSLLLWFGFAVCFLGIFILMRYAKEDDASPDHQVKKRNVFRWAHLKDLNLPYWTIVAVAGVFMTARVSDGFLILRFKELGGSTALCASLIGIFNLVSAFCCYPIGHLSDRIPRSHLLAVSFAALILCYVCFAYATGTAVAMVGVLLWGVQRGTSQVLLVSMVADEAPRHIIGTALGVLYLLTGLMALVSGFVAGHLADISLHYTFQYGFVVSLIALLTLLIRTKWLPQQSLRKKDDPHDQARHGEDTQEAA